MLQHPHKVRSVLNEREVSLADTAREKCPREHAGSCTELENWPVGRENFPRHQTG